MPFVFILFYFVLILLCRNYRRERRNIKTIEAMICYPSDACMSK